jgi:hypothetical protein
MNEAVGSAYLIDSSQYSLNVGVTITTQYTDFNYGSKKNTEMLGRGEEV